MQRIEIDFGPLKEVVLDIKNLNVFIGPQASGKSTIAKFLFFFKSLNEEMFLCIKKMIDDKEFDGNLGSFKRLIKTKLVRYFGSSSWMNKKMSVRFIYSSDVFVEIKTRMVKDFNTSISYKNIDITFSPAFESKFKDLVTYAQQFVNEHSKDFLSSQELIEYDMKKWGLLRNVDIQIKELLKEDRHPIFIPSGRSIISILSNQIQNLNFDDIDKLTQTFISRISILRPYFGKSLLEILNEKKEVSEINEDSVNLSIQFISNILKGRYINDSEGEKIYYDQQNYVPLNYSSSGQQESLWILLQIFLVLLENQKVFLVIEEPEAHLFPEAQKDMANLIALVANNNDSQVVVTTHSPYILATFNNLLYANKVAKIKEDDVQQIIDKNLWLDFFRTSAYHLENGKIKNIMDSELNMIQNEYIDSVSAVINQEFDKLFSIDV